MAMIATCKVCGSSHVFQPYRAHYWCCIACGDKRRARLPDGEPGSPAAILKELCTREPGEQSGDIVEVVFKEETVWLN